MNVLPEFFLRTWSLLNFEYFISEIQIRNPAYATMLLVEFFYFLFLFFTFFTGHRDSRSFGHEIFWLTTGDLEGSTRDLLKF